MTILLSVPHEHGATFKKMLQGKCSPKVVTMHLLSPPGSEESPVKMHIPVRHAEVSDDRPMSVNPDTEVICVGCGKPREIRDTYSYPDRGLRGKRMCLKCLDDERRKQTKKEGR